jgi:hypothetical protein
VECGLDESGSRWGQVECGSVGWFEQTQDTDRSNVGVWFGSSWLRKRTGGMSESVLDPSGSG